MRRLGGDACLSSYSDRGAEKRYRVAEGMIVLSLQGKG